jgi:protease-4
MAGFGALLFASMIVGMAQLASIESRPKVREQHVSHNPDAEQKIAIITVEGVISDYDGFIKRQIDQVREDSAVRAVVLRVNSPGGTVAASDYLLHELKELRKERSLPMVVSMGAIAASGGYYVSMSVGDQTDVVFAEPATWTGSIGVIIPHYNRAEMLDRWGVENDSIASGPLKDMGNLSKPMTEEERAVFESLVNASFERFKQIIRDGRPEYQQNPDRLDQIATGQIFTADQALENGLVDRIGFRADAVDRAIELAGVDPARVNVIHYKPEASLADVLMGEQVRPPSFDAAALLDLATPRAYYLCTWLPSLLSAHAQ